MKGYTLWWELRVYLSNWHLYSTTDKYKSNVKQSVNCILPNDTFSCKGIQVTYEKESEHFMCSALLMLPRVFFFAWQITRNDNYTDRGHTRRHRGYENLASTVANNQQACWKNFKTQNNTVSTLMAALYYIVIIIVSYFLNRNVPKPRQQLTSVTDRHDFPAEVKWSIDSFLARSGRYLHRKKFLSRLQTQLHGFRLTFSSYFSLFFFF